MGIGGTGAKRLKTSPEENILAMENSESLPSSNLPRQEVASGAAHRIYKTSTNFSMAPLWNSPASPINAALPPYNPFGSCSLDTTNSSNSSTENALSATVPTPPRKATTGRRARSTYTSHQLSVLEREFRAEQHIHGNRRIKISVKLGLTERQIKFWFQNRRKKQKKQTRNKSDGPLNSPSVKETPSLSPTSLCTDSNFTNQIVTNLNASMAILQPETENAMNYNFIPQEDSNPDLQQYSTTTESLVHQQTFDPQYYMNFANEPQQTRPNSSDCCYTNQQYPSTIQSRNINTLGDDDPYSPYFPLSQPNCRKVSDESGVIDLTAFVSSENLLEL